MKTILRYYLLVSMAFFVSSCSSMYGDSMYAEDEIDYMEGSSGVNDYSYSDYIADQYDKTAAVESRRYEPPDDYDDHLDDLAADPDLSYCLVGCKSHKDGCDIKGNISLDGEKIYHLPGQEYYAKTKINPEYGERWFCEEDEAIANGWRKSKR